MTVGIFFICLGISIFVFKMTNTVVRRRRRP